MDDTDDRESQSRVDDDVGDVPDVFDPSGETPEDSDRIANVPVRMTESSIRTVNRPTSSISSEQLLINNSNTNVEDDGDCSLQYSTDDKQFVLGVYQDVISRGPEVMMIGVS